MQPEQGDACPKVSQPTECWCRVAPSLRLAIRGHDHVTPRDAEINGCECHEEAANGEVNHKRPAGAGQCGHLAEENAEPSESRDGVCIGSYSLLRLQPAE